MKYLGVDYGDSKIGLSVGEDDSKLSEPLRVIRVNSMTDAVNKVTGVVKMDGIGCVVVGISEQDSESKAREFGKSLESESHVEIIFQDETLTTYDAQQMSIEAGKGQKKRREMEDAYSAALILQAYFDSLS